MCRRIVCLCVVSFGFLLFSAAWCFPSYANGERPTVLFLKKNIKHLKKSTRILGFSIFFHLVVFMLVLLKFKHTSHVY